MKKLKKQKLSKSLLMKKFTAQKKLTTYLKRNFKGFTAIFNIVTKKSKVLAKKIVTLIKPLALLQESSDLPESSNLNKKGIFTKIKNILKIFFKPFVNIIKKRIDEEKTASKALSKILPRYLFAMAIVFIPVFLVGTTVARIFVGEATAYLFAIFFSMIFYQAAWTSLTMLFTRLESENISKKERLKLMKMFSITYPLGLGILGLVTDTAEITSGSSIMGGVPLAASSAINLFSVHVAQLPNKTAAFVLTGLVHTFATALSSAGLLGFILALFSTVDEAVSVDEDDQEI